MDRDDQRCSISNMCHNESVEVGKNRGLDLRQRLKQPSVDLCHPSFPPLPLIAVDGNTYLAVLQVVVSLVLLLQPLSFLPTALCPGGDPGAGQVPTPPPFSFLSDLSLEGKTVEEKRRSTSKR